MGPREQGRATECSGGASNQFGEALSRHGPAARGRLVQASTLSRLPALQMSGPKESFARSACEISMAEPPRSPICHVLTHLNGDGAFSRDRSGLLEQPLPEFLDFFKVLRALRVHDEERACGRHSPGKEPNQP